MLEAVKVGAAKVSMAKEAALKAYQAGMFALKYSQCTQGFYYKLAAGFYGQQLQ